MEFSSANQFTTLQEHPSRPLINKKSQTRKNVKNNKIEKSRTNRKCKQFNNSNWSLRQNTAYKNFLKENSPLFSTSTTNRRSVRINVLISQVVKTRSSDQCRSHHQKMMRWHKDIPSIISHIENLSNFFEKRQVGQPNIAIAQAQKQLQNQTEDVPKLQNYILTQNDGQLWKFLSKSAWWDYEDHRIV